MLKKLLFIVISATVSFLSFTLSAQEESYSNSCLDQVLESPRRAQMYADFFYEEEDKTQFAQRFFEGVQSKLSSETACRIVKKKANFTCVEGNGSYPVCGSKVNNYYVAVVKDYVDSARLVVNKRPRGSYTWVPGEKAKNDGATLYLPNSSFCYEPLLAGSYDSQVYAMDMTPYLPKFIFGGDRRFVMAESLRELVQEKSDETPASCEFSITNYPANNVTCKAMAGSAWQACFASPNGAGYFVYTFLHGSPLMHITFNRWD